MATTDIAPQEQTMDISSVIVNVRSAAANQLEFLKALGQKMINAVKSGIEKTVVFLRRVWAAIPAPVSGAIASALTSTKSGYHTVLNAVKSALGLVTSSVASALTFVHNTMDWLGGNIAHFVGKVHDGAGKWLRYANADFTDWRLKAADWMYVNLIGLGTIVKKAYMSPLTTTVTTAGSLALTAGIVGNLASGGVVASVASTIPVVGGFLVAALSGGLATVFAIAGIASIGATASLVVNRDALILDSFHELVDGPTVEVMTEIVELANGEAKVLVTGDVPAVQAEAIAEQHVVAEVKRVEGQLKRDYPKAKQGNRSGQRPHNNKRR